MNTPDRPVSTVPPGGEHKRPIGGDAGPAQRPGAPQPDTLPLPARPDDYVRER
jgi:hypothetical protein